MAATPLIALVPARRHAAKKARSLDVAIREKTIALRTVRQSYDPRVYTAVRLERFDDFLRSEVICGSIGVSIMAKVN